MEERPKRAARAGLGREAVTYTIEEGELVLENRLGIGSKPGKARLDARGVRRAA